MLALKIPSPQAHYLAILSLTLRAQVQAVTLTPRNGRDPEESQPNKRKQAEEHEKAELEKKVEEEVVEQT